MDGQIEKFVSPSVNGAMIILGIGASEVAITPFIRQITGSLGQSGTVGQVINALVYMGGAMVVFNFAVHQKGLVEGLLIGVGADLGFRGIEQLMMLAGLNLKLGASLNI